MSSLLERIRNPELASRRRVSERELRESILRNLETMCRTRLGTSLSSPHYGLPDLTQMFNSMPDAELQLARALKRSIELYEPRLSAVLVRPLPGSGEDFMLQFEIVAQVRGGSSTALRLHTTIDPRNGIAMKAA